MSALSLSLTQCSSPGPAYDWQPVYTDLSGGLYSVWGYSETDVYVVGADSRDGLGPTALHFDGSSWTRIDTSLSDGDLWWVQGIGADTVFMTGTNGSIVRYNPQTHAAVRMSTPGNSTIYGIWGATASDVWAVGGDTTGTSGSAGVIWHYDGTAWANVTIPDNVGARSTLFKVWGNGANDVWAVGSNSATVHFDGTTWSSINVPTDLQGRLLTVHGNGSTRYAVGGTGSGLLLEGMSDGSWRRVDVPDLPALNGVYVPADGNPIAVGANGAIVHRRDDRTWRVISRVPQTGGNDFHAVWVDPTGAVWAVGGQIAQTPATRGMIWHFGLPVASGPVNLDPGLLADPTTPGVISTWGGTGTSGFNGDGHHRRSSLLYWPVDLEFSATNQAFVLDWNNHRVRRVTADNNFETIIGTEIPGDGDPAMHDLMAPGVPGTTVALNHPTDLLFQDDGTLLVMAWHNHKIRQWDPATGNVVVRAGRGMGFMGDGGPWAMALFKQPSKFVFDPARNLYIFDQANLRIRRVDAATGNISTIAGTGMRGFAGDGGDPLMAQFQVQVGENPEPEGALAMDGMTRLYVADTGNHRIRLIDFTANTITTVVGTGTAGFSGDGGPASAAQITSPRDIEIGPDGDLYIADTGNHCVRRVSRADGTIHTVAGTGGQYGFSGDRGDATQARLYRPFGISFDRDGNLFIADTYNSRIRRVAH